MVYGLHGLYTFANRGEDIGGWKVLEFRPGFAVVEKTTPHHWVMEEGILAEAFLPLETPALVKQTTCFRQDGDRCIYEMSSIVPPEKWGTAR